jgi:hypothetical protein
MKKSVKPEDIGEVSQVTLENLLMEKFRELQLAREAGEPEYFDALSQSIEILLKAHPKAYNDLMTVKEEMQKELEEEYMNIQNDASRAQDEIYRQHMLETRVGEADWLFRITYEESLIEVMQKNNIIGMMSSELPEIIPEIEQFEEEIPEESEEMTIEAPKPRRKLKIGKPRLMKQQKQG